tara:strand:+ start:1783 stop:2013 length:231 start_codon:yes stop_codon:yes gene_type:complete
MNDLQTTYKRIKFWGPQKGYNGISSVALLRLGETIKMSGSVPTRITVELRNKNRKQAPSKTLKKVKKSLYFVAKKG